MSALLCKDLWNGTLIIGEMQLMKNKTLMIFKRQIFFHYIGLHHNEPF